MEWEEEKGSIEILKCVKPLKCWFENFLTSKLYYSFIQSVNNRFTESTYKG